MERKQLTKEIINIDLKLTRKMNPFIIIVSLIMISYGMYEIFININKGYIGLIIFPLLVLLLGIVSLVTALRKIISSKGEYTINDGYVEKVFYDQSRNLYKLSIRGMKGIIITSNSFSLNENVYVVCYKNKALMCYNKNMYYL